MKTESFDRQQSGLQIAFGWIMRTRGRMQKANERWTGRVQIVRVRKVQIRLPMLALPLSCRTLMLGGWI